VKALKKRFEAKETPVKPEGPRKELVSEILEDELKEHVSRLSKSKGDCFITLFEIKCSDRMSRFLEHNIHIP